MLDVRPIGRCMKMTDVTANEVAIREFLLRRVPRLLELEGEGRLEQFRYVCGLAVQRVANGRIRPGTCVTALLEVAEQGVIPGADARRAIRQAAAEARRPPGRPALAEELKTALVAAPSLLSRSLTGRSPDRPDGVERARWPHVAQLGLAPFSSMESRGAAPTLRHLPAGMAGSSPVKQYPRTPPSRTPDERSA
jgi:hypothetical protein